LGFLSRLLVPMGTSTVFKEAAKASEAMSQLTKATTTGKKRKAAAEEDDTANAKPNKGRGKGKGKGKSKKQPKAKASKKKDGSVLGTVTLPDGSSFACSWGLHRGG
jgi:hypothetical protein